MQDIIAIGELKARAAAIGLTLQGLSLAAGLAQSTAWRVACGKSDPRLSTLRKLSHTLVLKEGERRDELNKLHRASDPAVAQ